MENVGRGERLRAFSWDADVSSAMLIGSGERLRTFSWGADGSSAMLIGSGERLGRGRLVRVSASGT